MIGSEESKRDRGKLLGIRSANYIILILSGLLLFLFQHPTMYNGLWEHRL